MDHESSTYLMISEHGSVEPRAKNRTFMRSWEFWTSILFVYIMLLIGIGFYINENDDIESTATEQTFQNKDFLNIFAKSLSKGSEKASYSDTNEKSGMEAEELDEEEYKKLYEDLIEKATKDSEYYKQVIVSLVEKLENQADKGNEERENSADNQFFADNLIINH